MATQGSLPMIGSSASTQILIFFNTHRFLGKYGDTRRRTCKLVETMRATTPKDKATKAFHPDLPEEDERFDPINLDKERLNEEGEGKQRQCESWHAFRTF